MSTQPLFTVLYVEKSSQHIDVGIKHKDGEETETQVLRTDFEKWLNDADRLEWCNDWAEAGEHVQDTGKYSIADYWDLCEKYHASDMYFFLLNTKIGQERLWKGIYNGIQSICNDYSPL